MLFLVAGLPARFSEHCIAIAARLVERALGPAEIIRADTLRELSLGAMRMGASHAVVVARQPGGAVRRALTAAGRSFVVTLDDPRSALAHLVLGDRADFAAAVRSVAASCASVTSFSRTPRALVLHAARDAASPRQLAAAIAGHLGLDLGPDAIAEIVRAAGPAPAPEAAAWWAALDPALRGLAEGALAPWLDDPPGEAAGPLRVPLVWGRELFFAGAPPGGPLPAEIDITGRARCLLRGPGIMLPPGRWGVTMALDLSPDAAEHTFLLEVASGAAAARTQIRPAAPGPIEASLTLDLADLPDRPLDLALSTERPAFAGLVALRHVTLTPHPAAAPGDPPP